MTSRSSREFLEDIHHSALVVREYVLGQDLEAFRQDLKTQDAVIHRLEVIGEAAGKLPAEITSRISAVPWSQIKSMRNLLAHQYWDIDFKLVWAVIHENLPALAKAIESYLEEE